MSRHLKTTLLASVMLLDAALAQAAIISLDQYHNPGPATVTWDYVYQGLVFSRFNPGDGATSGTWYNGWSIPVTSQRGPFVLNALTLSTFQNLETDPYGPYSVRNITVTGYLNGVEVESVLFQPQITDGVFRWFDTGFTGLIDRFVIGGDGPGLLNQYDTNAFRITGVPEPETWVLSGIGVVGLLLRRARQAQRTPRQPAITRASSSC
ncbi:hypothetical protein JCM19000A_06370 [Silvimonas sp. JCM 19000]